MIRHISRFLLGRGIAWIFPLLVLFLLPLKTPAQNSRVPFEIGNHAFRIVLHESGFKESIKDINDLNSDTILIVLGDTHILDEIPGGLESFLNEGGAVLVATDRPNHDQLKKFFGVDFQNGYVFAPPELAYRNQHQACPRVNPLPVNDIPIFRNLSDVYTNKPAYFLNRSDKLTILATFSDRCWVNLGRNPSEGMVKLRQPAVFAAAGSIGKGRAIVLSDHSVFINEMMFPTDNDNFDFAIQCIRWLKDGKRTNVLFLDEGYPVTDFEVPNIIPDIPLPEVTKVNQILAKLEQENLFNNLILGNDPDRRMGDIIRVLTIVITTAIIGLGCYRFLHARHRQEPGEGLFSDKLAQQTPVSDLLTQRHLDMVKSDNFWEAAHHLARDWFQTVKPGIFDTMDGTWRPKNSVPRFRVDAGWWRRWSWEGKVNSAWRLAAGTPRKMRAVEFARFVTQMDEIRAAQVRGIISFHNDR
jgi:hypothetical protein